MTVGIYPHDPLPGPVEADAIARWASWQTYIPEAYREIINYRPTTNPIREEPMYFPGNAWKGTSGMPQRAAV
jgi:hypothetical protein